MKKSSKILIAQNQVIMATFYLDWLRGDMSSEDYFKSINVETELALNRAYHDHERCYINLEEYQEVKANLEITHKRFLNQHTKEQYYGKN